MPTEKQTWGNPMNTVPMDGTPVLVKLEEKSLGSEYHVARYMKNTATVGGHFAFDMPKAIGWKHIEVEEMCSRKAAIAAISGVLVGASRGMAKDRVLYHANEILDAAIELVHLKEKTR